MTVVTNGLYRFLTTSALTTAGEGVYLSSAGTYDVVNAGDASVVFIMQSSPSIQNWTVSDSAGNIYRKLGSYTDGSTYTIWCYASLNVAALSSTSTLTITPQYSGLPMAAYAVSVSGLGTVAQAAAVVTTGSSATWSATVGPIAAQSLGFISIMSTAGGTALPAGWTDVQGYVNDASHYLLTATNGPISAVTTTVSAALNSSSYWATVGWVLTALTPTYKLEPKAELFVGNTWTDFSSRAFEDSTSSQVASIQRGHPDESTTASPSTLDMTFDNSDGVMSYLNPLSPYYGQIGLNAGIRTSIKDVGVHARLEDSIQQPWVQGPTFTQSSTGFRLYFDGYCDNWQESGCILLSAWTYGNLATSSFILSTYRGQVMLLLSTGTAIQYITVGIQNQILPQRGRMSLVVTVDNSGANTVVTAQSGGPQYSNLVPLGTWTGNGLVTLNTSATARFAVGGEPNAVAQTIDWQQVSNGYGIATWFQGKCYSASYGSGPTGTGVSVYGNFAAAVPGANTFIDPSNTANVWTVQNTAEFSDRDYRFWGTVAAWPQAWTPGDPNARTNITASGPLRRMGASSVNANSPLFRQYVRALTGNAAPVMYYPLEEGTGATYYSPAIGAAKQIGINGTSPGADSNLAASAPMVELNGSGVTFQVPSYPTSTTAGVNGADSITRFLLDIPTNGDTNAGQLFQVNGTGTIAQIVGIYNTSQITITAYGPTGNTVLGPLGIGPAAFGLTGTVNGAQCLFSIEMQTLTSSTFSLNVVTFPVATPNVGWISTVSSSTSGTVGKTTSIRLGGTTANQLTGTGVGHLTFGNLQTSAFSAEGGALPSNALNGWDGEYASFRFKRLCNEEGIQCRITGDPYHSRAMGPQSVETISQLLQECADADSGMWYELRQQNGFGYVQGNALGNVPASVALDYAQDQLGEPPAPTVDDQVVKNYIQATATADGGSAVAQLNDGSPRSIGVIGLYDAEISVNVHDTALPDLAGWNLHLLSSDEVRFPTLSADLANTALPQSIYQSCVDAEIGQRITVANPPVWLPPTLVNQSILGVTETIGRREMSIQWNTRPANVFNVAYASTGGTPDYSQTSDGQYKDGYGRVDTDGSVTAGAWSSTGTSLTVTNLDIPWVTGTGALDSATQVPFYITCGGEIVQVTSVGAASGSTQTLTVVRGQLGTPAVTHPANAPLTVTYPGITAVV